ncbi:hypothetical protein [Pseudothioclava nitratireducens]|nr:hypothetical protein [Defluviimonas nitratireducens]MDF1621514.1 hypothetical protein [Defluviimonas nitratireducens]
MQQHQMGQPSAQSQQTAQQGASQQHGQASAPAQQQGSTQFTDWAAI